jgi:hypothetical protein
MCYSFCHHSVTVCKYCIYSWKLLPSYFYVQNSGGGKYDSGSDTILFYITWWSILIYDFDKIPTIITQLCVTISVIYSWVNFTYSVRFWWWYIRVIYSLIVDFFHHLMYSNSCNIYNTIFWGLNWPQSSGLLLKHHIIT